MDNIYSNLPSEIKDVVVGNITDVDSIKSFSRASSKEKQRLYNNVRKIKDSRNIISFELFKNLKNLEECNCFVGVSDLPELIELSTYVSLSKIKTFKVHISRDFDLPFSVVEDGNQDRNLMPQILFSVFFPALKKRRFNFYIDMEGLPVCGLFNDIVYINTSTFDFLGKIEKFFHPRLIASDLFLSETFFKGREKFFGLMRDPNMEYEEDGGVYTELESLDYHIENYI